MTIAGYGSKDNSDRTYYVTSELDDNFGIHINSTDDFPRVELEFSRENYIKLAISMLGMVKHPYGGTITLKDMKELLEEYEQM